MIGVRVDDVGLADLKMLISNKLRLTQNLTIDSNVATLTTDSGTLSSQPASAHDL